MPHLVALLEDGDRYLRGAALPRALGAFEEVLRFATAPAMRARAWRGLSATHRARCDWDSALHAARQGLREARRSGDSALVGEALNAEAAVHQSLGDFGEATRLLRMILSNGSDERLRGIVLQNLGGIAARDGRLEDAERAFFESSLCFRSADYARGEAIAVTNYGRVALDRGEAEAAVEILAAAVAAARAVGDLDLVALATLNHAEALATVGLNAPARDGATAALGFFTTANNPWRALECLRLLGDLAARDGNPPLARRMYERALEQARELSARPEMELLEARLDSLAPDSGRVGTVSA